MRDRAPALLGLLALSWLLMLLMREGDGQRLGLLLTAVAMGAVFVRVGFGFAGGYRQFLLAGDGRAMAASLVIPALLLPLILPLAAADPGYTRFVAPINLSLILGAAMMGFGMQMTNGCASGAVVAAGEGSRRMWVALPFFSLGGVAGSLFAPALEARLPSLGHLDLLESLGPWGGVLAMEAMLLALAWLLLRRAPRLVAAPFGHAALIAALAGLIFLLAREPWGITFGLTIWGAKALRWFGLDAGAADYWMAAHAAAGLEGPWLGHVTALTDVGMFLGALLAAAGAGRMRHRVAIGTQGVIAAALGGLLMGVGGRLSYGCNIGAFISGTASGSLHGLVWLAAALPGAWLGLRLRGWSGLPRA
ncbi:YeeE/YedE family protein [Roseococcus sp. SDR]|uniref:YeeE/YedE thiosulfate transporter family protein n=1 Tax=Roseococcus sp. SDR TaxID=2835532 RepID=UPI001BCB9154|nr:YeeE/YedE thiosulfate transporter family protein [Roseococcus sp. SDR]MBS7791646.1 YeeE/YedE family protein [Roseococcus sp. SDR]MBV1846960.1 YeeE/YedE family protein [Roseococcus sp. SDR]